MANLIGRTGNAAPIPSSQTLSTSGTDLALGSRWFDADSNEYIVVDCQQAFVAGEWVYIDSAHLATRLTDTLVNGRVGIIVAAVSGSDTKAFALIYGLYTSAVGDSNLATSLFLRVGAATSDIGVVMGMSTSADNGTVIYNAYAVTAPDSGLTSGPATSFVSAAGVSTIFIGFQVFLMYPWVMGTTYLGAVDT